MDVQPKAKLWLVLKTTLSQQSLTIGLHLKSNLLTPYRITTHMWLIMVHYQTLAHFRDQPLNHFP